MRKYKFRGKSLTSGEYVYGYYWKSINGRHWIRSSKMIDYEVDPETVGQYIGLIDENKKEIYEDDKVVLDNTLIGGNRTEGKVIFNNDPTLSFLAWGIWNEKGYHPTDFLGHLKKVDV